MAMIVGIKFRGSNKIYYFDPAGIEFAEGDGVIVETARGQEYGTVALSNREVDEKEVVSPLKPVLRKATAEDDKKLQKNLADRAPALRTIREKAAELGLNMKLVDAEYTFDRSKLIFYFTADGRVDFRELVRTLASIFKVRIELRQIYERDDTKMRGALAACGRPCCCTTHLPDFEKVSIKMAKVQGLSLNPQKISGVCGRLLCCLKYENDYYSEVFKKMPKVGSKVRTADGDGVVESNDLIKQTSRVRVLTKDGSYDVKTYALDELKTTRHIGHKPHIDHNRKFMQTERTRAPFFFSLITGLRFPPFPASRAFSLLCAYDLDGIHPAHRECGQDAACRRNIAPTFAAHLRPQAVRIREHLPLGTHIFTQSVELAPRVCYHDVGLRINTGKE